MREEVIMLREIAEKGIIVEIHTRGLRYFEVPVLLLELGLTPKDPRAYNLNPGVRNLAPKHYKRLKSVEVRARRALEQNSIQLVSAILGGGFYVPIALFPSFLERFNSLRKEFEDVKEEFVSSFPEILESLKRIVLEISRRVYRYKFVKEEFHEFDELYNFLLRHAQERLEKAKAAEIYLSYSPLILISDIEIERARAEVEKKKAEVEKAKEEARIKAIWEEARKEARRLFEENNPIELAVAEIRARLHQELISLKESISQKGFLHPMVRERVKRVGETLKLMGETFDDSYVVNVVNKLLSDIEKAPVAARGKPSSPTAFVLAQSLLQFVEEVIEETRKEHQIYLSKISFVE